MTDTEPTYPPVVCGARETRPEGQYECIRPPEHTDQPHVWFRLVTRGSAA